MVRFVHSADWQLGMTRHFFSPAAQATFSAARLGALARIGAVAREQGCSFVVVSGDVFETNQVGRAVVAQALDVMGRFAPEVTFYLLPGNHDPLDAGSVYRSRTFVDRRPGNVVVLEESEPMVVDAGVELVAAPWLTKRPLADLLHDALAPLAADGTVRIVVGHGALDALSPARDDPAAISLGYLEAAMGAGVCHYVALGDRHSTTGVGESGRIFYAGTPEATDYDEVCPGNVLVVSLEEAACSVERVPVGTWRFVRREVQLGGRGDCDALIGWLEGFEDKARTVVKLDLVGQLGVADKAFLDEQLDHQADLFGALEVGGRRSELVVLANEADVGDLGLEGYAREALDELRALAGGQGEVAGVARDALGLLYRLVRGRA